MDSSVFPNLRKKLMAWYRENARDLPWRRTRDPYSIWISEIMLQQTQVITVIPYYQRWLNNFPDVHSLADAKSDHVMSLWAGLGYYRRARMLHAAAQDVVKNFEGKIPNTVEGLTKLPGIGRYTAGAIASIAFDQAVPIVDGNVIRILTRIFAYPKDISKPKNLEEIWNLAEKLVSGKNPGTFNQAMMELGALICLPQNPDCPSCPVKTLCTAYKMKSQENFPVKSAKQQITALETAALILKKQSKILCIKQPADGRWGGMWMFPHWENQKSMLRELRVSHSDLSQRLTINHTFTRYKIKLKVYEYQQTPKGPLGFFKDKEFQWLKCAELDQYAFPAPHKKIVQHLKSSNE